MGFGSNFRLLGEFGLFLKHSKRWWLAPIVIAIILLSVLIITAQTTPFFPLVYTLF